MRTNWAGNFIYTAKHLYTPHTVDELCAIIKKSKKVRALGSRHSFNNIADSPDTQVSTEQLNQIISLDKIKHTITVEGGVRYGELCTYLHDNGYALHNLASLPHISIAGACATATHGSGVANGNLATAVSAIEWINAAGEIVSLSREKDKAFAGVVVNLGALGVVTKLTLDLQPTFSMRQVVYQDMPMKELAKNADAILSAGYSVSLFTTWQHQNINQVWIKSKVKNEQEEILPVFHGAKLADKNLHPLEELSAENCTDQSGIAGPWYERMPHFKMGFTPSNGAELQTEYFIPFEHLYEGMMAIEQLKEAITPLLYVSEIRAIAADDLWMSPFYKRKSVAFHFTWKQEWEKVRQLLPLIEEALAPFDPRPHWGKLFSMKPRGIERLDDFKELMMKYDPEGKFTNEFIAKFI